jgi:tRNA modification GTPase
MSKPAREAASSYRLATPTGTGAIAIIDLFGSIDSVFEQLPIEPVRVGCVKLRSLAGVDQGVVVRWSDDHVQLMPHGGGHIVGTLLDRLEEIGAVELQQPNPHDAWPEASDLIEAFMLDTLTRAQSPAAVDLLLAQPDRWRSWDGQSPSIAEIDGISTTLNRLIEPATIVAVGSPNVGKSTLTNALARSTVSIVSEQAGTTRDHVGVMLELPTPVGSVVVRWIDAPGFRADLAEADSIEREAIEIARAVVSQADLIVHCGDSEHGFCDLTGAPSFSEKLTLRVGMRSDREPTPGVDIQTAALQGEGVPELAVRIRQSLIPDKAMDWPGPWRFHPDLPMQ